MTPLAQKTLVRPVELSNQRPRFRSQRTAKFTESVIREMTRLAMEAKANNLAQGFPDFSAPEALKQAAQQAITDHFNQYPIPSRPKPFPIPNPATSPHH